MAEPYTKPELVFDLVLTTWWFTVIVRALRSRTPTPTAAPRVVRWAATIIFGTTVGLVVVGLVESIARYGLSLRLIHDVPSSFLLVLYAGVVSAACVDSGVGYWLVALCLIPAAWLIGGALLVANPPQFPPRTASDTTAWVVLGLYFVSSVLLLTTQSRRYFYQGYLARMAKVGVS